MSNKTRPITVLTAEELKMLHSLNLQQTRNIYTRHWRTFQPGKSWALPRQSLIVKRWLKQDQWMTNPLIQTLLSLKTMTETNLVVALAWFTISSKNLFTSGLVTILIINKLLELETSLKHEFKIKLFNVISFHLHGLIST